MIYNQQMRIDYFKIDKRIFFYLKVIEIGKIIVESDKRKKRKKRKFREK